MNVLVFSWSFDDAPFDSLEHTYEFLLTFFIKNAGEMHFFVLEREKGPHTSPSSHTGTKYEAWFSTNTETKQGTKRIHMTKGENLDQIAST
jgi:hypothetical protein